MVGSRAPGWGAGAGQRGVPNAAVRLNGAPCQAAWAPQSVDKRLSAIAEIEIDQLRYEVVIEIHHGLGNPRVPLRDRQGRDRG